MVSDGGEPGEEEGFELEGEEGLVQVEDHGRGESRLGCLGDDAGGNLALDRFQK